MRDEFPPECPFLPPVTSVITAAATRDLGFDRGPRFYAAALSYAHSLWRQGLPARSLLLLNRAMGCDLRGDEPFLREWPLPYAAVAWILRERRPEQYIGNPRRHWQHLATRMVEPRKELRVWRAWACWHLSRLAMPEMPADEVQIREEGVREPEIEEIADNLGCFGIPGEAVLWAAVADGIRCESRP